MLHNWIEEKIKESEGVSTNDVLEEVVEKSEIRESSVYDSKIQQARCTIEGFSGSKPSVYWVALISDIVDEIQPVEFLSRWIASHYGVPEAHITCRSLAYEIIDQSEEICTPS